MYRKREREIDEIKEGIVKETPRKRETTKKRNGERE